MSLKRLISLNHPRSPISEAYRTLRTNIQFSGLDKKIKTILLTSPGPEEGKSTTICNLAITMAQAKKKILLIDADLRKPKIHKYFEHSNINGLTTTLLLNKTLSDVIRNSTILGLDILTSGPTPPNPSEILGSNSMKELIEQAREKYDRVLVDSPPIGLVTDPAILSAITDGTIMVVTYGKTHIDEAKRAKQLLENVNANILGVVLNKVPIGNNSYFKNAYYQNYYSEAKS